MKQRIIPPIRTWSLRLRLSVYFGLLLTVAWLVAALLAWKECREYADEFFDTQQVLFAKRLVVADFGTIAKPSPLFQIKQDNKKGRRGRFEDDALGFAVFSANGKRLLTDGENGDEIPFIRGRVVL